MKTRFHISLLFFGLSYLNSLSSSAQWSTATIGFAPSGPMVTSAGGKAFFAGGYTTYTNFYGIPVSTSSQLVAIYDATTNQWTTSQLSKTTTLGTATSLNGKALFAGGNSEGVGFMSKVDIYNTNTSQWTLAALSQPRAYLASTSVGNKAIFAGGQAANTGIGYTDVVDIYDASTDKWTVKNLSQARYSLAATSVGSKALFAGGDNYYNNVDIYDVVTDSWTTAQISQARSNMAATSVGSKAFFAGGGNSLAPHSSIIDIYDAATNQWSTATLSQGRSGVAAASLGNLAYFAGGTDATGNASNVIDLYDAATNQWSSTQLPTVKGSLVAVSVNNKILFLENGSGKVDIYTLDAALPVNIISFSGLWADGLGAQLSWQTSLETNNDHYEIQRSSDAKSFETIGRVQGKGTTQTRTDYSFTDADMPGQIGYYRLKQVDLDGSAHLSNIISVNRQDGKSQSGSITIGPVPTSGSLTLQLSAGKIIRELSVYSLTGGRLYSQTGPQTTTDVSGLPSGVYLLDVLTTDGQHLHTRFVKQ